MQRSSTTHSNHPMRTLLTTPAGSRWGAALSIAAMLLFAPRYSTAQVPAVVATSQSALTTTTGITSGQTAVDACGNVYVNPTNGGNIVQIAAGTGTVKTVSTNTNNYNNGPAIAIDPAKANLMYVSSSQWYSDAFTKVPITNCTLGTPVVVAPSVGCPANKYYYGTTQFLAPDALGNVYFVPSACNTAIYEQPPTGAAITALATWPNSITSLAVDLSGNVYFTDSSTSVYQVKPPFPGTAAAFGSAFAGPAFVSVDALGDLMISDKTGVKLYEMPNTATGINAAGKFAVAAVALTNAVSSDLSGNFYTSNATGPLGIRSSLNFANTAVTGSASATIGYVFNSAVTPASIAANTGTAASAAFVTATGGTCVAGTAYTTGQSCTQNLTFSPTLPSQQRGAVLMSNAAGAPINEFSISGTGLGAAATIDPGTITPLGSGFTAPSAIAAGPAGNIYVADKTANTVTVFAAGSGTGTVLSTGTLTLSAPGGVAVDSAGNVYIADTGNSRIVEVPVINGALAPASSVAYTAGLKAPAGLAFGASGALYIADTGNKRLLAVSNLGGTLNFAEPQAYGTGLTTPASVAVDLNGNVFVADTGNNVVYEFAAPLGSAAQAAVITGLNAPTSVATAAAGSLFVVDSGSANVYRYPYSAGTFGARSIVGDGILNPVGVAADTAGNLYVTDSTNKVVDKVVRSQGNLAFGAENVGTPSSPLTATVNSSGTQSITFPSPSYTASGNTAAGFAVTSDGCGSAGTVASGSSCAITAVFTPPAVAPPATETLTLKSNAIVSGETIVLTGTGRILNVPTLKVALTSPASGQVQATQAVTFTVTINQGAGTVTPGGTMKISVNGNQVSSVAVTGDIVQITLPNGLTDGTVVVTAVYTGDQLNYSGATGSLTLVVAALPTSLGLTIAPVKPPTGSTAPTPTLYTNPYSVIDTAANASGPLLALTATLSTSSNVIAGGIVSFYYGSAANPTLLGMASVTVTASGLQATIQTSALRAGTTNIVENNAFMTQYGLFAVYSGDTTYGASTSPTATLYVANATAACGASPYGCTGYTPPTATVPIAVCALGSSSSCYPSPFDGANFSIAPVPATITIVSSTATGQGSGSTTLNAQSYGGWTGVLTFTCAGLPAYAQCSTYPGVPQINAQVYSQGVTNVPIASNQVQLTITTNVAPSNTKAASLTWQIAAVGGLLLLLLRRRIKVLHRNGLTLPGLALLLAFAMTGLQGCGSGSLTDRTPVGSSTVTVYVNAAQINSKGVTYTPNDANTPSFQVQLVIQ
jgi:sugar lactone lactonase YvrE